MAADPASNSNKSRAERPRVVGTSGEPPTEAPVKEKVEAVVSAGGVVEKKKTIGAKFRALVGGADAKGAATYVVVEVLIPAARGLLADVGKTFVDQIFYPHSTAPGRRIYGPTSGSRVTYNAPTGYRPAGSRPPLGVRPGITAPSAGRPPTDYVIASRREAETVVERLGDLLDHYQVVTVLDFHDLMGLPSVHTQSKWGWDNLRGVDIRPVRDGYMITMPDPEPINF
jgi:hypothetical protein